jgi:sporadic carbohydrate cluster protein (TIGR04323 family)
MKNLRGYVSSRPIDGNSYPQKLQNLAIRDFAHKNKFNLILSGTEWNVNNSYLMFRSIIKKINTVDGIIFFSIFQISEDISFFEKKIIKLIKKKKLITFALEEIIILTVSDLKKVILNLKIKKTLNDKNFKKYN